MVIQGRELKGHPDRHIFFGEDFQSLAVKKLGRSLYSGRPVPSLCEWRAIQSQFIWCAGLSCLSRSSNNQLHKRDRLTGPEGLDPRPPKCGLAPFLSSRSVGNHYVNTQPDLIFIFFSAARKPHSLRPHVRHADQARSGSACRATSACGVLAPPSSRGRPGERRSRAASPSTA